MPSLNAITAMLVCVLPARPLPPLPRPIAGQFVGNIGNTVVVAGGSWWKTKGPGAEAKKAWDRNILALDSKAHQWQIIGRLPLPLAYGGAASIHDKLVFAGGEDGQHFSRRVFALKRSEQGFQLTEWPSLPFPLANFAIAATGSHIYVFGGQKAADAPASNELLSLAVDSDGNPASTWEMEPPLPGDGRILPSAAACDGRFYVASGAALVRRGSGSLGRNYLRDFWSYDPVRGWFRLADLPRTAAAAPAICNPKSGFLVMGGDDRVTAGTRRNLTEKAPEFSRSVLRYDFDTKMWLAAGEIPIALVTTGAAVLSNGDVIIPGGEDHPGSRSGLVLHLHISQ